MNLAANMGNKSNWLSVFLEQKKAQDFYFQEVKLPQMLVH